MVMGATSGAGKSLMFTAFCRIFSDMGYTVVPFKAQNMSLNSMVTDDGRGDRQGAGAAGPGGPGRARTAT